MIMNAVRGKGLRLGLLSRIQGFKGLHNFSRSQLKTLTSTQTDVAQSITKHIFLKEEHQKNKNMVFSPLSLHVALSMVAAGSKGPILNELLTFLRAESTDHLNLFASQLASVTLRDAEPAGGPLLCFANGVWVERSISLEPSFKKLLTTDYVATLDSVDFKNKASEVVNQINLWVEEKTNGLIKNILSSGSVDSLTRLILTNALYFKGAWEDEFDASKTKNRDFHLLNGTSVKVPFMTSKKNQFIGVFDGFKVLGLPYEQGEDERRFSMYIFLPDANDGLSALVEQVASESGFLERYLPHEEVKVGDFNIPKFEISSTLNISNVVEEMGLVLPFSEEFAKEKIVEPLLGEPLIVEPLYVSNIIHKSFIEVNEEGTEAAAVTVMSFGAGCLQRHSLPKVIDFVADHPFLFFIREDLTGTILLIGQMLHPLHS